MLAGVALVSKSQALRRASFVLTDVHAGDMHSSVSSLVVYETTPDGRCDVASRVSRGPEGQRQTCWPCWFMAGAGGGGQPGHQFALRSHYRPGMCPGMYVCMFISRTGICGGTGYGARVVV